MSNVLIAGCGYLGNALGQRLEAAGHTVWGLRRGQEPLSAGIRPLTADLCDPATLSALPPGLEFIFYTAAPEQVTDAAYQAIFVTGLGNLLAALRRAGQNPRRLFFVSSTAVYGQHDGQWVDERSATEPVGFRGRRLLEGERLVAGCGWPATRLRLGGIYGPGRDHLIRSLLAGTAVGYEQPAVHSNRIHRDDAAAALAHLMGLEAPEPVYIVVDHEPAPQAQVLRWLASHLSLPAPPLRSSQPPASPAGKRCCNARLRATGFEFTYPTYKEGYAALAARYA